MYCSNCGYQNIDTANFCRECGKKLHIVENSVVHQSDKGNNMQNTLNNSNVTGNKNSNTSFIIPDRNFYYIPGEYAYAKCIGINNGTYHFYCIDNLSHFYWTKQIVDIINPEMQIGDYVWVHLKELMDPNIYTYKAFSFKSSVYTELNNFYEYRKLEDIIEAPIISVEKDFFTVLIGPSAQVRVFFNELPTYIDPTKIKANTTKKLKIVKLQKDNKKINIKLTLIVDLFYQEKKNWYELPVQLSNKKLVFIPSKVLEDIKESKDVTSRLFQDQEINVTNLISILEEKYAKAYQNKKINIKRSRKIIYMDFDLGIRNEKGVPQSAGFKKKEGDKWTLNLIGFTSAECVLEKYVYISNWSSLLENLAEMALGNEDWDYKGSHKEKNYILKQYLLFNFYKSWLDNLIIEENGEALFNTGLVDSSYDDIYCYLKKNTLEDDFYERKWEFGYFAPRGKGPNGKKLMSNFSKFPNAPSYVDVNHISDLYFNPEKELECDYDHIIKDNLERLPLNFLKSRLCYDQDIVYAINACENSKTQDYSQIISLVKANNERGERFRRDLQSALKDAVDTARKYCKWNYKTAIPIYYPRNNGISLLLPLKLQTDPKTQVDVALVVERLQNGNYQGQTILTLEMAYQDARQICRPNSEWLTINNIVESNLETVDNDD